jgi:iron complex outermembrane receptor protein
VLLRKAELFYPPEALAEQLHGDVLVRVSVGVDGEVVGAALVSGPEVFAAEGLAAARRLRFAPARQGDRAVPSQVDVVFHFAPPALPVDLEPDIEVVVEGSSADRTDTHARTTLGPEQLERSAGQDLAETVSQIPGVTMAGASSDAAKPVIRGQQERRLLLLYDGIRHESQKWGPDHAPEIDPFSAGQISVIKGAAGVRYGPDAIGGVILVEPPPLRQEPGVGGKTLWSASSNGRRGYGAARLDLAPEALPGLVFRVEGDYARGAALSAPDYVLGNTGSELWNAGLTVGYVRERHQLRLAYHHYDLRAGVFYGVSHHSPDDFLAQVERGAPVNAQLWTPTYAIDRPYQSVRHELVLAHGDTELGSWGALEGVYAFQLNHRREYEQVRDSIEGPQFDFVLRTHSLDLRLRHDGVPLGTALLKAGAGATGSFQENVYEGLPLVPNFRGFGAGAYAYSRLQTDRAEIELGARYDALARTAFLTDSAYDRHLARDTLDPSSCTLQGDVASCPAAYDALSLSLGGLWKIVPQALEVKLDLSSANRFPGADELYLNGTAPTFPVYALGSPELGTETTWGASPTLGLRLSWLQAELSAYANYVDDYIYFAPELGPSGEPAFDVTIRGAFPRYGFSPVDALFHGADGGLSLGPEAPVGLELQGALVRASDLRSGQFLVGTPADRARASVHLRPRGLGRLRETFLSAHLELIARQGRVDPRADLAPAPEGAVLLGLSAGTDLPLRERTLHLGLDANNLTNAGYREYTSLLRYYADQPGRDLRVRIGLDF